VWKGWGTAKRTIQKSPQYSEKHAFHSPSFKNSKNCGGGKASEKFGKRGKGIEINGRYFAVNTRNIHDSERRNDNTLNECLNAEL
jgi:hypothetical protein